MNWEAAGALAGLASLVLAFWGGYAVREKKQQVQVSGSVHTIEQQTIITSQTLEARLKLHPSREELEAAKDRLARLENAMARLATLTELDDKIKDLDAKRSRDTAELHRHVESTAKNLHTRINDVCDSLGARIGALPGTVIEVLKNTGAI